MKSQSAQQRIHWTKLNLLGMCAQMKGSLTYIRGQVDCPSAYRLLDCIHDLELEIIEIQKYKMKVQKKFDNATKG